MSIDQSVAIWCLAVPAVIALLAAGIAAWLGSLRPSASASEADQGGKRGEAVTAESLASVPARVLVPAIWWLAVMVSIGGRASWESLPDDEPWFHAFLAVLLFGVCVGATSVRAAVERGLRWLAAGIAAVSLGYLTMPSGEGWSDLFVAHRDWIWLVTVSSLAGAWAFDRLLARRAERWLLWVALASLAGPLMLAGATYGALAEVGLAACAATATLAIVASLAAVPSLGAAAYAAIATAATLTASSRFYSYEDHPSWMYGLILFLPPIVVLVDWPLRRRSSWLRVVIAALVSAALIAAIAWAIFFREPAESW